jgi:hypothetical protein
MTDHYLEAYKQGWCEDCELYGHCDEAQTRECLAEYENRIRETPLPIPKEQLGLFDLEFKEGK